MCHPLEVPFFLHDLYIMLTNHVLMLTFAGFLIPLIQRLIDISSSNDAVPAPYAVVLVPTPDLAHQVKLISSTPHFLTSILITIIQFCT